MTDNDYIDLLDQRFSDPQWPYTSKTLADTTISHERIAAARFGVPIAEVTPKQRNTIKELRFFYIYSTPHQLGSNLYEELKGIAAKYPAPVVWGRTTGRLPHREVADQFFRYFPQANDWLKATKSGMHMEVLKARNQTPVFQMEMDYAAIERRVLNLYESDHDRASAVTNWRLGRLNDLDVGFYTHGYQQVSKRPVGVKVTESKDAPFGRSQTYQAVLQHIDGARERWSAANSTYQTFTSY